LAYKVAPEKRVLKYLKKLKEKKLKEQFINVIYNDIAKNPDKGIQKQGNLSEIYIWELRYDKTDYRIAYIIEEKNIVPILLVGSHENFYRELKRITRYR
jgi:mRNA-degrading endonuclease RelE of RelBE toxin-antitoxin system